VKIQKDAVVRLHIEIDDEAGNPVPPQELVYLHGGYGNLFPKLEAALTGLEPGGKASVTLAPAEGFGERDPGLVRVEPRSRLPRGVAVGMALHGEADEGDGHRPVYRVTQLTNEDVTLDANHPLAGRTMELRMKVLEVRAATEEEITHGHVHGPHDGHHH
jgi:FKBP-type peptidyl-prolyl cis-trans isomerase SlyD